MSLTLTNNGDSGATARANFNAGLTLLNTGTTVGLNLFALTNPSGITFPRFNADNSVTALSAANMLTALGALASAATTLPASFLASSLTSAAGGNFGTAAFTAASAYDAAGTAAALLASANSWTNTQTFAASGIRLLGSNTGYTSLTSANAGTSNFTLTLPAVTDTVAVLGTAQTFTGAQTFNAITKVGAGISVGNTIFTFASTGATNCTVAQNGTGYPVFSMPVIATGSFISLVTGPAIAFQSQVAGVGTVHFALVDTGTANQLQFMSSAASPPSAFTLFGTGSRGGTDSNTAGAALNLCAGLGTGTATPAALNLQVAATTGSGTGQQSASTQMAITNALITITSGTVLKLGNAATTGLTAGVLAATTNATITFTDSTGQAYRVPCII